MTQILRFGIAPSVGLLFIVVALLAGAEPAIDPGLVRLQGMPLQERKRLVDNLQRFDRLPRSDQEIARELDRRLSELDNLAQKANYLGVLRRYHLWCESLPEARRDELRRASPDQRMALVSKFMSEQKTALKVALPLLQIADLGAYSPVDVALIYKVWQRLDPADRATLEKAPPQQFKNQISKKSERFNLSPEGLLPSKYDRNDWETKVEKFQQRPLAKGKQGEERNRHLALNLYFLRHPPRMVAEVHLVQFLNELPEAVRATFDVFPPDEARRRASIAYRLAFTDDEIPPPRKPEKVQAAGPQAEKSTSGHVPPSGPAGAKPAAKPQSKADPNVPF